MDLSEVGGSSRGDQGEGNAGGVSGVEIPNITGIKRLVSYIELMRILKRPLDWVLCAIFFFSVAALFLAHEDSFAREVVCAYTGFCPTNVNAKAWNKIFYDLAVGALVSLIFYGLVVRLPDYRKRLRIKKGLANHYQGFREDCIAIMLMVSDGTFEWGFHEVLVEQDKFRDYFKEKVSPDQDRWDAFQNKLDEHYLQELIMKTEILRDEIAFVLNNVDIPDDRPFEFLKRLSRAILSMRNTTLGYDETKQFAGFLWSVFAGWDVISGYRDSDIIQEMIDAI